MRKMVAILALVFCILPVRIHAQLDKTEKLSKGDQPSLAASLAAAQQGSSPKLQTQRQDHLQADVRVLSAPAKDGYDHAAFWVNVALAFIGAIGIGAAFITLGKLERQTKATEEAANAAYGSVVYAEAQLKLIIEKERARLEITPGTITVIDMTTEVADFFYLSANLRIRNIGTSRAYITSSGGRFSLLEGENELSENLNNLSLPDQFFDPNINRSDVIESFLPEDGTTMKMVADAIQNNIQTPHLYGFIEYETLGGKWRREFGYRWNNFSSLSMLGGLVGFSTNMTDADRIQNGYWVSTERDKPEYPIANEHLPDPDLTPKTEEAMLTDRPLYRFWKN